ncbi:HNH endonuclease [Ottowia thiooxydans]|uniref:HNH endonuclease n=1 Tax=Ottowia thiooxydans TaxID=219182 RepID=UPI00041578DD|nr:HNH endonuclease signature motif containing protein [Ottowia thiooxydans]
MNRPKLKMLQPRIKMIEDTRIKMAPPLRLSKRTGRDADPRRTLPLNGAAWQRLRASVLAGEPLCRACAQRGQVEPATDVDHVSGDPSDNSTDNLCPLCHSCHSIKTAMDQGKRVSLGCGLDGWPIDLRHPWNAKTPLLLRPDPRRGDEPEITSG